MCAVDVVADVADVVDVADAIALIGDDVGSLFLVSMAPSCCCRFLFGSLLVFFFSRFCFFSGLRSTVFGVYKCIHTMYVDILVRIVAHEDVGSDGCATSQTVEG